MRISLLATAAALILTALPFLADEETPARQARADETGEERR